MSQDDETFGLTALEMYIIFAMLTVFSVFGSAGNAVVLYVFSTAKDDLVSTLFIIALAIIDFSTCLVIIPFTIVVEFVSYNVHFDLLCRLYLFLITSNIPLSAFVMTAIAVDRYLCICHPFVRLLTPRRARVVVVVLAALAAVFGVLGALTHSVYQRAGVAAHDSTTQVSLSLPATWNNQSRVVGDEAMYTGQCNPSDLTVSSRFARTFQKCYTATFVVCFGTVAVLYSLIYRSVLRQRRKRQRMKAARPIRVQQPPTVRDTSSSAARSFPAAAGRGGGGNEAAAMSQCDNKHQGGGCLEASEAIEIVSLSPGVVADVANDRNAGLKRSREISVAAETTLRDRIASIKTAAMLFVVTLVFVISFFPSLAMTVRILPYSMTVFYMYFANNVANPVIYSFMNTNFRKRLVRIVRK